MLISTLTLYANDVINDENLIMEKSITITFLDEKGWIK